MAKKKFLKLSKLPKWAKVLMWIFGIVTVLSLILLTLIQIWIANWKIYRGDGFSLRYPSFFRVTDLRDINSTSRQSLLFLSEGKGDGSEKSRIYFFRYDTHLKGFESFVRENFNFLLLDKSFSSSVVRISGRSALVFEKNGGSGYFREGNYLIDAGAFSYDAEFITLINKPLWEALYYDFILRQIVLSARFG